MMSLAKRISSLPDEELLAMISKAEEYTEEALKIANEEIIRRGLEGKTIKYIIDKQKRYDDDYEAEIYSVSKNSTASILKSIGFLEIIVGIVLGIILSVVYFAGTTGIIIMVSSFVAGIIFIGFGEIINLLHQINERQKSNT